MVFVTDGVYTEGIIPQQKKTKRRSYLHQTAINPILVNDQLDALFLNVFISCLYMFRATSAYHQEDQLLLIHHLV